MPGNTGMPTSSSIWCLILSAALSAGCQTMPVRPFSGAEDTAHLESQEQRLWDAAEEFDAYLADTEHVYPDPALTAYIQSVMDRLYPEYHGVIRVRILSDPSLNAFALPNGSIYINTGLLARLDNEAQVATVLAHEATHFINKHSWQQSNDVKSKTAAASVLSLGIPILPALAAVSSIYGFSRDLERDADVEGLNRLRSAGYDIREAPKTFDTLQREVEALKIEEPYFFSSHPRLTERIESFNELIGDEDAGGLTNGPIYRTNTKPLQEKVLNAYLSNGEYKNVILILEDPKDTDRYPGHASYFLGEAYRLRGEDGDEAKAEDAYIDAIERVPDFADGYKALGVLYYKQKKKEKASNYLERYLQLSPEASDRGYIEHYIRLLEE